MTLLARAARPGDTVADVRRREGEAVMGLWLPLAFATLVQTVVGICGKPPARSELLASWSLPELSKAVRQDEERKRADDLGDWFESMERRYGQSSVPGDTIAGQEVKDGN